MTEHWRLPRSTADLTHDWTAAARAYQLATTDAQRAAVVVRVQDLRARQQVRDAERQRSLRDALASLGLLGREVTMHLQRMGTAVADTAAQRLRQLNDTIREGMANASSSGGPGRDPGGVSPADLGGGQRSAGLTGS